MTKTNTDWDRREFDEDVKELDRFTAYARQEKEDFEYDLARIRRGKSWFPSTEQIFEVVAGAGSRVMLLIQLALAAYVVFHFVSKYW